MIDIARIERENEELYRRILKLERTIQEDAPSRRLRKLELTGQKGAIPREPIRDPDGSYVWHDIEAGKLRLWNGSGWDSFSKDV